ncbi:hypothetical protein FACS1894181_05470 [Bacteroidia bacterium]|nr:hypothetical protein FACS1894181_05470 [Bacteroidia bacterium]
MNLCSIGMGALAGYPYPELRLVGITGICRIFAGNFKCVCYEEEYLLCIINFISFHFLAGMQHWTEASLDWKGV